MKLSPKSILVIVLALAAFLIGFIFLRGPTPHISVKAETLFSVGPIDITNTMLTSWIVVGFLVIGVFLATRRWEMVPRGAQNVVEGAGEAFYNFVVSVAGEQNARRFFPVVATIFIFVLASNWLSLLPVFNVIGGVQEEEHGFVLEHTSVGTLDVAYVPFSSPGQLSGNSIKEDELDAHEEYEHAIEGGQKVGELLPFLRGPSTDLNTPLALAIVSAIAVETWGITAAGFFAYGNKFLNFGGMLRGITKLSPAVFAQGFIDFFVGIIELLSELARLVSFTFRLFGNMFAGEVVILMFTFLTPLFVGVIILGLEVFIGVIQAFIFAMLTLVFGTLAVAGHGGHDASHTPKSSAEVQIEHA